MDKKFSFMQLTNNDLENNCTKAYKNIIENQLW